jgi:hypothetical protein
MESALTVSKAMVTDSNGKRAVSATSAAEIAFVAGVTSAIQTQIDGKQATSTMLTAIAALAATGFIARTGAGAAAARTLLAASGETTVTNGDGVAGNPTIGLAASGVVAGTYVAPTIVLDAKGRATSVTNGNAFPVNPALLSPQFEDWLSSDTAGVLGWTNTNSGAGSPASVTSGNVFSNNQGVLVLPTGTTATGRSAIHLGAPIQLGYTPINHSWRNFINVLSTGAEEYAFVMGLADTPAGAGVGQTNGCYFLYDRTVSVNWLCVTTKTSLATVSTTSVAVTNTAYKTFNVSVNAAGTSVVFSIDGVVVATNTTNIPGFGQPVGPLTKIAKSVGTTSVFVLHDYYSQNITWTGTPRP